MDNYLRIVTDAVSTLENLLPDLADAIENEAEERKVRAICNQLAKLVNETRDQL